MIALVAILKIKPGMEKMAGEACLEMAAAVRKNEKDCLLYEPYLPADGSPKVFFLEKYTTKEALEEHRQSAHYKAFRERIKDALDGPPESFLLEAMG